MSARVLHIGRSRPERRYRFKAAAPRITERLMRPGTVWAGHAERLKRAQALRRCAWEIHRFCGVGKRSAFRLAACGLHWTSLCLPVSDPHVTAAEEFERGNLTLAEVYGFATVGGRSYRVRCAGFPPEFNQRTQPAIAERPTDDTLLGW